MTSQQVGRSGQAGGVRASDLIAAHLKALRGRRGYTVKELAARCAELGAAELTANVLTNIEVRRRDVSSDELLVLALALDVAPAHLITPLAGSPEALAVTPTHVVSAEAARLWIRGEAALLPDRARSYLEYAVERAGPARRHADDHAAAALRAGAAALTAQYEAEAHQFLDRVRSQVTDLVSYLQDSVASGVPTDHLIAVLETVKSRAQSTSAAIGAPAGHQAS